MIVGDKSKDHRRAFSALQIQHGSLSYSFANLGTSQPFIFAARNGDVNATGYLRRLETGTLAIPFDSDAIVAAFAQPNGDGSLDPNVEAYLNEVGGTRPSVVLAFPPKAAGTFLRTAAITAVDGQLVRTTYSPGGSADSFYLPTFLNYYCGAFPARTMVTHVHMQALHSSRVVIEALDLKPAIMIRSIPDMLASYADELAPDPLAEIKWLNVCVPTTYPKMTDQEKGDFLIEMMGPWYASYYATWMTYAAKREGRVCLLNYDSFVADPSGTLEALLAHSRVPSPRSTCQAAIDTVWAKRREYRYNKGVSSRGHEHFTGAQIQRLKKQIAYYPILENWADRLIPSSAERRLA